MSVKLLIERHFELLSLKRGCTGSSESTLVKMPHCWKSHVAAHISLTTHKEEETATHILTNGHIQKAKLIK